MILIRTEYCLVSCLIQHATNFIIDNKNLKKIKFLLIHVDIKANPVAMLSKA